MGQMPFRQIHLDFHTGGMIPGVGSKFDKEKFQQALIKGHVSGINIFAKCHHGWLYYKNGVTPSHPSLEVDLLEEMLGACADINVETQIYISAGLDEEAAKKHPEWLFRFADQSTSWAKDYNDAGYHILCFNTPYLDHFMAQVIEIVQRFDTKGLWIDIVEPRKCRCQTCMNQLIAEGKDPRDEAAVTELGERVYLNYLNRMEQVHAIKPDMKISHNSGNIPRARRDLLAYYTHFELESLPTGGWGYDHFPLSARYVQGIGKEFVGMTGKFHNSWGEFGGFKHPNALRYEAALNLANGAKMCVGDQMHPQGLLDEVTYRLIGEAYKEVEQKEPWCDDVTNVVDIGLLTEECVSKQGDSTAANAFVSKADTGAVRMMLEGNYLFDVIDLDVDFNRYKVVVLPDGILVDERIEAKLKAYVAQGGKILATGKSGLDMQEQKFVLDMGVQYEGKNPFKPDYFIPSFSYQGLGSTAFVMYSEGVRIALDGGEVLGEREDSYFNRDLLHFCSHAHTPNEPGKRSPGMVKTDSSVYIPWHVFNDYATKGSLMLKDMVAFALDSLLGNDKTLSTSLKAQGVTMVQHQEGEGRYVHHLLYATPVNRGEGVEIIEDIVPVFDIENVIQIPEKIKKVYLAPQMTEVSFEQKGNKLTYTLDKLDCHQMVVLAYA